MEALEKVRQRVASVRRALASAGASVEDVRQAIRRLEAERQAVASAPVPMAEAVEAVEQTLDRMAAAAGYVGADTILIPAQLGRPASIDVHSLHPGAAVGFLVQCLRPALRAALLAQLEADYRDLQPGLPAAERAERLAELDRQLLELGRQEEQLITELAEFGLDLDRRGDANPSAVLGLDAA